MIKQLLPVTIYSSPLWGYAESPPSADGEFSHKHHRLHQGSQA